MLHLSDSEIQEEVKNLVTKKFPWDMKKSLELALLRSLSVPSISSLLQKTGRFYENTDERVEKIDVSVMTLFLYGYDSTEGKDIIQRINRAHRPSPISNEEYLFVLSTFIFVPMRWIDLVGRRKLSKKEEFVWYSFWREIGKRMGMKDIPADLEGMTRWTDDFEEKNVAYSKDNEGIANKVVTRLTEHLNLPRWFVILFISSMLDERTAAALGIGSPSFLLRQVVLFFLRLRNKIL